MRVEEINKAYECCKDSFHRRCDGCPVTDDCCHDKMPLFVLKYALELLNDQKKTIERLGEALNNVKEKNWGSGQTEVLFRDDKRTIPEWS